VRLAGTVVSVERIGDRWKADLRLANGDRVPVLGQAGAAIPSTAIVAGASATIVGIVKRPYPTATDRRFAVLPRGRADISINPGAGGSGSAGGSGPGPAAGASTGGRGPDGQQALDVTPDTDLATLFEHVGAEVRVGGLVSELTSDGFLLDDGTAVGRLVLGGDAAVLLPHIQPGDAVAARGTVTQVGEELRVIVANAAGLVRVGDLGEALPVAPGPPGSPGPTTAISYAAPATLNDAGVLPTELSVATLGGLSAVSLLVTLLRRRAVARRSRALVLARLAAVSRGPG
jgi:hypothetical protein